jgi:hypothetical protein
MLIVPVAPFLRMRKRIAFVMTRIGQSRSNSDWNHTRDLTDDTRLQDQRYVSC